MAKILKNQTVSNIEISDMGITVPGSGQYVIPTNDYPQWEGTSDLIPHMATGDIILNDGGNDITILSDAIDILKGFQKGPAGAPGATGAQGPQGVQGIQGDQGPQGTQGPQGNQGDPGTDGKTILNGTAVPTTEGVDGDFYIKTDSDDLYGPKTGGSWGSPTSLVGPQGPQGTQGIQGIQGDVGPQGNQGDQGPQGIQGVQGTQGVQGDPGADGKTVLNGTAVPTTEGVDGDFYIKTDTNDLYGPKSGGSWGSATSLVGPQGAQGNQGIQGIQGIQGPQGDPGPSDHTALTNIGTNTHAQIDTHIALTNEHIDWSASGAGTIHATNYTNTVYTHPNHTGDVTSTGDGAQVIDKTAISGKTLVSAAVGDHILIGDASDADNLKKVTVQTVIDLASGSGEINTASNVGTGGVGVFKQKSGVNLEFKKINAGSAKVTITDDTGNNEVDIDVATGTTASTVCVGNDSRLSDSRTPTSHATSHQLGGGDAIKLDDLAAPDDNTDLNATTSKHGLLPKLGGGTSNFLRADGTWAAPAGGGSSFPTYFYPAIAMSVGGVWTYQSASGGILGSSVDAYCRNFDDTSKECVFVQWMKIPTGATNLVITTLSSPASSSGTSMVVNVILTTQAVAGAYAGNWTGGALTFLPAINVGTTYDLLSYHTHTVSLASLSLTPGNYFMLALGREATDAGDTLVGDWSLSAMEVSFT